MRGEGRGEKRKQGNGALLQLDRLRTDREERPYAKVVFKKIIKNKFLNKKKSQLYLSLFFLKNGVLSPKAQESEIEILISVQKKETLSLSLTHTCLTSPSSHRSIKYLYNIYIKYKRLYNNIKYLHLTNASRSAPRVKLIGYQFSSVAQSCLTLCDPMNRSTPGLLVHHQLPEFTQTHVH